MIQISTRLLISGNLVFFATVVGKINRSGCWCYWCNLSPFEWGNIHYEKGTLWAIDLMKKYLHTQVDNNNMTANEKKGINQPLLFDAIPIENYVILLLHAEIGVSNKIIENDFLWITDRMEKKSEEEVIWTNCLINS